MPLTVNGKQTRGEKTMKTKTDSPVWGYIRVFSSLPIETLTYMERQLAGNLNLDDERLQLSLIRKEIDIRKECGITR